MATTFEDVKVLVRRTGSSRPPKIPPRYFWPQEFDGGNAVTGWFDRWVTVDLRRLRWALWPLSTVDVTPLAWWHDLWYWLGYFVPWDTPLAELKKLRPRPKSERNWVQRRACDRHFRIGLRYLDLPRWRAKAAWEVLQKVGADHYFNGGPTWAQNS